MGSPELTITLQVTPPDWGEILDKFEEMAKEGMSAFRSRIEAAFHEKAASTLKSSLEDYQKGLSVTNDDEKVMVTLEGWLPVAVETGVAGFDMKPGILKNAPYKRLFLSRGPDKNWVTVTPTHPGWWHPGIQARVIHQQVQEDAEAIVAEVFKPLFERVLV